MLKRPGISLFALLVVGSWPAAAVDCSNATIQMDLNQCAGEEFSKVDGELNTAYQEIMDRLAANPESKKRMVAAQRAWLGFRDAECEFVGSAVEGGSMQPMVIAGCMTKLTQNRLQDFRRYLACAEGDVDCPVPAK